jgi:hypothetical protein
MYLNPSELSIGDKLKVAFRVFGPNQTLQTGGIMIEGSAVYFPQLPSLSPYFNWRFFFNIFFGSA